MLEKLEKVFREKEARHNELVEEYNKKIESKKKVEDEMIEIEKQIIHNQGAMTMLNELAESITKDQQPQEIITSDANSEIITSEA